MSDAEDARALASNKLLWRKCDEQQQRYYGQWLGSRTTEERETMHQAALAWMELRRMLINCTVQLPQDSENGVNDG